MIAEVNSMRVTRTSHSRVQEVDWSNLGFGKVFSDHMVVIEYHNGTWQAPEIKPYGPIPFSPAISALHYGQALFEGLKAYRNDKNEAFVFRPEENAKRLNASAERLCMPSLPTELFLSCLHALLEIDKSWIPTGPGEALYIRPHMFAIDEYVGVKPSDSYLFVIFTCPVGAYYTSELKVKVERSYTRAANGGTGSAKAAGNYAAALLPTKKAQEEGFQQLLWTDAKTHEYLEESGTMNVIFRKGNTLITPELTDSILSGVTRNSVLQLAKDWGYEVEEKRIAVKELEDGLKSGEIQEAFGAGTAATIAPIREIQIGDALYTLQPWNSWEFAPKVSNHLDALKRGLIGDAHNWNFHI